MILKVRAYGLSRNGRASAGMISHRSARFQKTLLKLIERLGMLLDRAEHMTHKERFSHRCPARAMDDFDELFGEVFCLSSARDFPVALIRSSSSVTSKGFMIYLLSALKLRAVSREDGSKDQ